MPQQLEPGLNTKFVIRAGGWKKRTAAASERIPAHIDIWVSRVLMLAEQRPHRLQRQLVIIRRHIFGKEMDSFSLTAKNCRM